jgi:hypothetical protein
MIPGKFAEIIPAYVINALVNALQILPEDRTGGVEDLRDDLSASPSAAATSAEAYSSMAAVRRSVRDSEPEEIEVVDTEEDYDYYENDYTPEKTGVKKSTIITLVVSVVVCLVILVGVIIGISGMGKENEDDTTTSENISDTTSEVADDFINVSVPDFRGMNIEDVKADEKYKAVLNINTVYEDSDKEKGTVIAQDLPEGTVISSINKRSIILKVSDGLQIPDLVGEKATEAKDELTKSGFKSVEIVVGSVAEIEEDSNKVTSIVYYPEGEAEWQELPEDRRISATQKVVIYCYGEYAPPTTEEESTTQSLGESIDDIIGGMENIGNIIEEF